MYRIMVTSRLSPKYWTLAVPLSVAENIELFTHALSGITIIIIPDKEPKYRTVRLNTRHLATLLRIYLLTYLQRHTILHADVQCTPCKQACKLTRELLRTIDCNLEMYQNVEGSSLLNRTFAPHSITMPNWSSP